jgi:hypothetical protein
VSGVDPSVASAGIGALGDEFKMHYFTVREGGCEWRGTLNAQCGNSAMRSEK